VITRVDVDKILRFGDEESRLAVLEILKHSPLEDTLDKLFLAMADSSWRVRKEAVEIFIAAKPADEQITALLEKLRDGDNAGLRNSAAEAIVRLGTRSARALKVLAGDNDPDVRKFVVDVMGGIGSSQFMPVLLSSLADTDENVSSAAAEQIGNLGDNNTITELLEMILLNNSVLFRFSALTAMSKLNSQIRVPEGLLALVENDILRKAVYECLGSISDEAAADILRDGFHSTQKSCRGAAVLSWYRIYLKTDVTGQLEMKKSLDVLYGSDVVLKIIEIFDLRDLHIAESVTAVLGLIGDLRGAETLLSAFACEYLVPVAISALSHLGVNGLDLLISKYSVYNDIQRCAVCSLIAELNYSDGRKIICDALGDSSAVVRRCAVEAVGKLGMTECINDLVLLLSDREMNIESNVVSCLKKLSIIDPNAIKNVASRLAESNKPEFRRDAVILCSVSGGSKLLTKLVKDESVIVRLAAVSAIGKLQLSNCCNFLKNALLDENPDVRVAAAEALAMVDCHDILESLFHALKDEDVWVQCAVLKSIAKVDKTALLTAMKTLLPAENELLMITCLELLEKFGTSESIEIVKSACENQNQEISLLARSMLTRLGSEG
jgi:HEAT repeat protein